MALYNYNCIIQLPFNSFLLPFTFSLKFHSLLFSASVFLFFSNLSRLSIFPFIYFMRNYRLIFFFFFLNHAYFHFHLEFVLFLEIYDILKFLKSFVIRTTAPSKLGDLLIWSTFIFCEPLPTLWFSCRMNDFSNILTYSSILIESASSAPCKIAIECKKW